MCLTLEHVTFEIGLQRAFLPPLHHAFLKCLSRLPYSTYRWINIFYLPPSFRSTVVASPKCLRRAFPIPHIPRSANFIWHFNSTSASHVIEKRKREDSLEWIVLNSIAVGAIGNSRCHAFIKGHAAYPSPANAPISTDKCGPVPCARRPVARYCNRNQDIPARW